MLHTDMAIYAVFSSAAANDWGLPACRLHHHHLDSSFVPARPFLGSALPCRYGPVADESLFNWPSYTIESIVSVVCVLFVRV